jgi:hypothetical protein
MVCIALAGCAPVRSIPPQASGAELEQLVGDEQELYRHWYLYMVKAPADPPDVAMKRVIKSSEAEAVYEQCMAAAGYPNYGQSGTTVAVEQSDAGQLALYICVSQYPLDPSTFGLFSAAQLEYLYDYFHESLIPCLESSGFEITDVPDRADFLRREPAQLYAWSPYQTLHGISPRTLAKLTRRCPEYPNGLLGG